MRPRAAARVLVLASLPLSARAFSSTSAADDNGLIPEERQANCQAKFSPTRCAAGRERFAEWQAEFAITYPDETARQAAYAIWLPRFEAVLDKEKAYADGTSTYFTRLTQFSDRIDEDKHIKLTGLREALLEPHEEPQRSLPRANYTRGRRLTALPAVSTASSADWRPWLTGAEQQSPCESCWAFTTSATVTGAFHLTEALANNFNDYPKGWLKERLQSAQMLMDCNAGWEDSDGGTTCDLGGSVMKAMASISKSGKLEGVVLEADQPWKAGDYPCKPNTKKTTLSCTMPNGRKANGCNSRSSNPYMCPDANSMSNDQYKIQLKEMAEYAPVGLALTACSIPGNYAGGVVSQEAAANQYCGGQTKPDHAVTLVGWGYDSKTKLNYWLIRNSWSQSWGENGHMRIQQVANIMNIKSFDPCIPLGPQDPRS